MRSLKGRTPDSAGGPIERSSEVVLGRAKSLNATSHLLTQYRNAREELNAGLALLQRAIDLRELLSWGVLDLDEAREEAPAFNRAADLHKARKRVRS
jgi:hypothetical protein